MADTSARWMRLKEEQLLAIQQSEEQITLLEKYKNDYKALEERLTTLPDKVRHDVMVPFGPLALMPGQLVHTNEVTVLLGDNWFVERSAKQACEIASRRIQGLDRQAKALQQQRQLLEPRLQYTEQLQEEAAGGDIVEIKEEYDEHKERLWKEQHKKRVKDHYSHLKKERGASEEGSLQKEISDADLWRRLDELQIKERRDHELERLTTESLSTSTDFSSLSEKQRVRWKDEDEHTDASSSGEDSEEEESDEITQSDPRRSATIHFRHSKNKVSPPDCSSTGTADPRHVTSPGDIYPVFYKPPSILKRSIPSHTDTAPSDISAMAADGSLSSHTALHRHPHPNQHKAFSGTVVERSDETAQAAAQPTKKLSKFRQMRQQQGHR